MVDTNSSSPSPLQLGPLLAVSPLLFATLLKMLPLLLLQLLTVALP